MAGMPAGLKPIKRVVYCPGCGYDLRGAVSDRCPECGASTDGAGESRIPWTQRRTRGRVRAYVETVGKLILRPRRFVAEAGSHLMLRDAVVFHRVSVGLAVGIAVVTLAIVRGIRDTNEVPHLSDDQVWLLPVLAATSWYWWLVPVGGGLWAGGMGALACLRRAMSVGEKSPYQRRELRRLSYYLSGVAPVVTALACAWLFIAALMDARGGKSWVKAAVPAFIVLIYVAIGAGLWSYFGTMLAVVMKTGTARAVRGGLLVAVLPIVGVLLPFFCVITAIWAWGYLLLAVRSMVL
jgi:hypothetical protein